GGTSPGASPRLKTSRRPRPRSAGATASASSPRFAAMSTARRKVSKRNKLREQKAWNSLNQRISLCDEERRNFETERLGGLEIDHQLELGGLLDRQVGGLRTLENLVHVGSGAPIQISKVRSIGHEAP